MLSCTRFDKSSLHSDPYEIPKFGNLTLLHFTDCHAQLLPVYYREPNVNLGFGRARGRAPHLVGKALLDRYGLESNSAEAHAFSHLNFVDAAQIFGKIGGFSHLATLIKRFRAERGDGRTLLLDGGDTWQGSATSLWTRGKDMVDACNMLGVDIMTGHWEFTYGESDVLNNTKAFNGEFIAQNIKLKEEALFDGTQAYDDETGHAFKPFSLRKIGGVKVAIIGQAFPYTPIANPQRLIPAWRFGINEEDIQTLVDTLRNKTKADVIVLLSHNGMDVDLKLASRVCGIDVILGGHTHDGVPKPSIVDNPGGKTLVTNAGSNGKFLGVLDLSVDKAKIIDYRYHLLPVFSNLIDADSEMETYVAKIRAPYRAKLDEKLAITEQLLYRRGNFNGTFDQLICDAQREVMDAEIAFSPGFRWGTSLLPGQNIRFEDIMNQTAITYPETYVREMSGAEIKSILEDISDNLFNKDPYYQQGGDMVRVTGFQYVCDPNADFGQRISNLTLDTGIAIAANKKYKAAGWASVSAQSQGLPIWEVVSDYLRDKKVYKIKKLNRPVVKNTEGNRGISDYGI